MSTSYNRVIVIGNVTRQPELRQAGGTAVTEIGIAINDRRKSPNGDWIEETTFVDVTLWGRTAENACEYLQKGSSVLVEGRLKLDTWNSTDGKRNSKLRVVGERVQFLTSPNLRAEPTKPTPQRSTVPTPFGVDDEIPF